MFCFHLRGRTSNKCRASGGAAGERRPVSPWPYIFFEVPTHMASVIEDPKDGTLLVRCCVRVGMALG